MKRPRRQRFLDTLIPDWEWIPRIWYHHFEARRKRDAFLWAEKRGWHNLVKYPWIVYTDFWLCVAGTIAILLRLEDEKLADLGNPDQEIAWESLGTYETDYGTGRAWASLVVVGWRFCITTDGSL